MPSCPDYSTKREDNYRGFLSQQLPLRSRKTLLGTEAKAWTTGHAIIALVKSELDRMRVVELDHPPYSPDLAPCDFWLFAKLKKDLAGRHFDSRIDLGNAIWRSLKDIPPEDYKMYFLDG